MYIDVKRTAIIFKAFCDENRIRILQLLKGGEKCACMLLEEMNITQPTLSHHMKILCRSGLVVPRKEGKWTHYSLNRGKFLDFISFIEKISSDAGKERIYFDTKC
jgi:ArsR family transcriptional regulator